MKRRMVLICLLLACVMLLASCDSLVKMLRPAPKTAEEVWERIGESMDEYNAFTLALEMNMTMIMEGYEIKSVASGTMSEDKGEDYYYYSEINADMECDELDIEQSIRQISAYWDGKAFEISESDDAKRKLYSEMTAEQYEAYSAIGKQEEDSEFDLSACTEATFVQNEDKTWTLTYSGYTKKAVQHITKEFGTLDQDMFGAEILDVQITVNADQDFFVTDLSMVFEFDVEEGKTPAPVLDIGLKVTELGEITRLTDQLDISKCTKVEDLAIIKQIDEMLEDRCNAEKGSFRYEMLQTAKFMGETETSGEVNTVEYGMEDDRFYFDMTSEIAGVATSTISYKNGSVTVSYDGESYTEKSTDEEARGLVEGLINDSSIGYASDRVCDVKSIGDGSWEIEQMITNPDVYESAIESMGAEYKSTTQTIKVTVKDGTLISIVNEISIKGSYVSGASSFEISLRIVTDVDFHE